MRTVLLIGQITYGTIVINRKAKVITICSLLIKHYLYGISLSYMIFLANQRIITRVCSMAKIE